MDFEEKTHKELDHQTEIHHGNQFKKIFKQGSWYFIGSLLTKATGFFLLPVYTKYLSPADYGVLNSLNSITNLLPIFISLYLDAAFGLYYFSEKKISEQRVQLLYSTLFWFICLWGVVVVIAAMLISPFTFQPLLNVSFLPYIPLIMIPALFGQLSLLGSVFLRSNLKVKEFSILNFVVFICATSITILLLTGFKMGIRANLYGAAVGSLISFSYYLYISIKYSLLNFSFNWKILWTSLLFSLPLIPNIAAGWIGGLSDRLILVYYGKIEQVGLYSISAQIALILYMINDALTQVQGPIALSALTENREEGKKQISEFLSFFVWIILFCYLLLTFFSKEILYFMTDVRYHSAYQLVAVLAFIYVLSGIYRVFTTILSFHEKMWVISCGAIISAIVSMIINFLLIPYWGQWAAAWARLFSMFGYTAWLYYWSQKVDPIPVNYRLIVISLSVAVALLTIEKIVEINQYFQFWIELGVKIVLCGIYVSMMFFLPSLNEVKVLNMRLWDKMIKHFELRWH